MSFDVKAVRIRFNSLFLDFPGVEGAGFRRDVDADLDDGLRVKGVAVRKGVVPLVDLCQRLVGVRPYLNSRI